MDKVQKDRIFAAISIFIAICLGYTSFGYPANSAFFPRVLSVAMGALGMIMLIRLNLKARKLRAAAASDGCCETTGFSSEKQALRMAGFVFGSIITYGTLMWIVNYEAATVIFLVVLMRLLGFRRLVWLVAVPFFLMLLLYGIFFQLLGVPRPESLLFY